MLIYLANGTALSVPDPKPRALSLVPPVKGAPIAVTPAVRAPKAKAPVREDGARWKALVAACETEAEWVVAHDELGGDWCQRTAFLRKVVAALGKRAITSLEMRWDGRALVIFYRAKLGAGSMTLRSSEQVRSVSDLGAGGLLVNLRDVKRGRSTAPATPFNS